jgi:hypothetical protein
LGFVVFGMDAVFHDRRSLVHVLCSPKVYGKVDQPASGTMAGAIECLSRQTKHSPRAESPSTRLG